MLLLLPIVSAELLIEPSSLQVSANVGYQQTRTIKLTNTFNLSIFNINFSSNPDMTYPFITELATNSSVNVTVAINPTSSYTQTKLSTVKFSYYTTILDNPKYHNVSIYDTYYQPSLVTAEQYDYIRFTNFGNISHTVTSTYFNKNLAPNQTDVIRVDTIGLIDYYDQTILFHSFINVINKTQELTYNGVYDKTFSLTVISSYNQTSIGISIPTTNFSIQYDKKTEEVLRIENLGSYKILNVSLTSSKNWISFDENNFDVDPNSINYLIIKIDPNIITTAETNQTYDIDIFAKGINTNEIKQRITIFIPYEPTLTIFANMSNDELRSLIIALQAQLNGLNLDPNPNCPANEPFYDTQLKKCRGDLMFKTGVQYNYSQEEIQQFLLKLGTLEENQRTQSTYQNPVLDDIRKLLNENIMPQLAKANNVANQSLTMATENKEEIDSGKTFRLWMWTIIIITLSFGAIIGAIKYNEYKKKLIWSG